MTFGELKTGDVIYIITEEHDCIRRIVEENNGATIRLKNILWCCEYIDYESADSEVSKFTYRIIPNILSLIKKYENGTAYTSKKEAEAIHKKLLNADILEILKEMKEELRQMRECTE